MTRKALYGRACVVLLGLLSYGCGAWDPTRYQARQDLLQSLDQATVLMPTSSTEAQVSFQTGSWEFDQEGYIHLTRLSEFFNRLTFLSPPSRSGGLKVSFRYRTRWTRAGEQRLGVVFREKVSEVSRIRFVLSLFSNGQASLELSEVDGRFHPLSSVVLAQGKAPSTDEAWRTCELTLTATRVDLRVDGSEVLSSVVSPATLGRVDPNGLWGLELSRTGEAIYRTQAVLGDLRLEGDPEKRALFSAAEGGGMSRAEVSYLNWKYSIDRAYLPPELRHVIKQVPRSVGEKGREIVPCLFAPPGSVFRFSVDTSPGDGLRARYGFDTRESGHGTDRVTFTAKVRAGGRVWILHSHTVTVEEQQARGDWFEMDVPLPATPMGRVEIELAVRSPESGQEPFPPSSTKAVRSVWASPTVVRPAARKDRKPNVILMSVDTLRADYLRSEASGAEGPTPSAAAFSKEAVVFSNAFTVSPWTMPAHFSLFTGLYPSRHGLNRAFGYNRAVSSNDIKTLAELLRDGGYFTAAIASDHSLDPLYGFDKGFQSFFDVRTRDVATLMPILMQILEKHHRDQFFLFFHTYDPHGPLFRGLSSGTGVPGAGEMMTYEDFLSPQADLAAKKEELRRLYGNHVRYFDGHFGQILKLLQSYGVFDDSVIIFMSDHGEELLDRTAYLHGHSLYDEVLRVPLLIRFPDGRYRGSVDALTALVDIAPTILNYLGIASPQGLDGISFMDVVEAKKAAHRDSFVAEALSWGPERKSVRTKEYKYILTLSESDPHGLAPRDGLFNPLLDVTPKEELYSLRADAGERRNIASAYPELAKNLRLLVEPLLSAEAPRGVAVEPDPEVIEALKALGYVLR